MPGLQQGALDMSQPAIGALALFAAFAVACIVAYATVKFLNWLDGSDK